MRRRTIPLILLLVAGVLLTACQPTVLTKPTTPAWNADAPDPHVARFGTSWYAYTTGTSWGNRIGVLRSDRPDGGWRTITGKTYGSTALPTAPGWQVPDTQWAPGVYRYAGRYVMFYAAKSRARSEWCLSAATATDPAGPFTDGSTGPLVCADHLGGAIDPHPFVDQAGSAWLHYKTNDGEPNAVGWGTAVVSRVMGVKLAADGVTPVGDHREVLRKDSQRFPWQTTVDNPQMVLRNGVHHLFHSGGDYIGNGSYVTGHASCDGPLGPCRTSAEPMLASYEDVAGPAGGTVVQGADGQWWLSYHAWPKGCYSYGCGTRRLYVAPLRF